MKVAPKKNILISKTYTDFEGKMLTVLNEQKMPPVMVCRCQVESLQLSVSKNEIDVPDDDSSRARYEYILFVKFTGVFTNMVSATNRINFIVSFDGANYPKATGVQILKASGNTQKLEVTLSTTEINHYLWLQELNIKSIKLEAY